MKFFLPIALLAASASAQSAAAPAPSSACQANYIVEACLTTQNTRLAGCAGTDYSCQCSAYIDILTCYNNCPDDTRKPIADGQRQIFCGYASQYPSSTAGSGSGSAPSSTGGPAAANTNPAAGTPTSSGAAPSNTAAGTKTASAADLAVNAGGLLAAIAGVVVAVL